MFPARGAAAGRERNVMPPEKYFSKGPGKELQKKVNDLNVEWNPYVFMTSYKLCHAFPSVQIPGGRTAIRVEKEFSLFNQKYTFPFEPTPNPFPFPNKSCCLIW